ncbi:MAG: hypothetical protein R3E79_28065 [Caldilineaceae bacterium]
MLDQPYAIVTANVLTAPTEEEAAWLAASGQLMTYAIRRGSFIPLLPPERAAEHPDLPIAAKYRPIALSVHRTLLLRHIDALVEATAANGLMIFTAAYGIEHRVQSLELLAQAWQR